MVIKFKTDFEQQEALEYRPGTKVQLKQCPGVVDIIAEYDPMMVPPVSLVNDPKPRYPEELELLARPMIEVSWFKSVSLRKISASAESGRSRLAKQRISHTRV